jgi:predicted amidophosphoribosyltransferase
VATCNPQKIIGNWYSGIALDVHTTSSVHLGVDELGHDRFETTYSELGGLLHRLKYKSDRSAVPEIVQTAVQYLRPRRSKFDLIVPVPPSKTRSFQPVIVLAQGIGAALVIPVALNCIRTTRPSAQLKDVSDPDKRRSLVIGLYTADSRIAAQKNILLFDDLYRSGATMNAITDVLMKEGKTSIVYALTITKTRSRR